MEFSEQINSCYNDRTQTFMRNKRLDDLSDYEKTKRNIIQRKNDLFNAIEKYTRNLLAILNENWSTLNEASISDERRLQKEESVHILPTSKVPIFKHKDISEDEISALFGNVTFYNEANLTLSKVKTVDTHLLYVNPIRPTNEDTCLVGCALDNEICTVSVLKDPCVQVRHFKGRACSIIPTREGETLYTSSTTTIQKVSHNGKLQPFLDFDPLIPKGMCISDSGECFVGLRENTLTPFKVNRYSERQVRRIDKYGRTRQIYEFDEKQTRLFTLPSRVCVDNSKIYVLDSINEDAGRIVSIDFNGNMCWIYQGYNFAFKRFCPNDLVLSPKGYLIMSDTHNDAVHFLSSEGDILLYKVLTCQDISLPCGIGIDFMGRLWIGTYGDKEKSKIHILSIAETEQR